LRRDWNPLKSYTLNKPTGIKVSEDYA
jgi:hypothetical protein